MLVVAFFPLLVDDCNGFMDEVFPTAKSTDLTSSPDRTVQAAGQSDAAIKRRIQSYDAEQAALGVANLGLGEKLSFEKIDQAIEFDPSNEERHLHKAAMLLAAGRDPSEAEGKAFTIIANRNSPLRDDDRYYRLSYSLALRDVSVNLPPGPARDRVNAKLCPEVKAAKLAYAGERSYDGVVCP